MGNDIQKQKPWTTSQIQSEKPNAPRTDAMLSGYIAGSMNGGHNKVIAYKRIMAGEFHKEYRLKANFQMLTPLSPAYQQLKITFRTYFVPDSAVWKNAEKYTAQRGGYTEIKIQERPNLGGKVIPWASLGGAVEGITNATASMSDTTLWRDSFISSYIPRIGIFDSNTDRQEFDAIKLRILPKVDALRLRGRVKIYNYFERNKEFDPEMTEYDGDTVSESEWQSYLPIRPSDNDYYFMRARRENNYWTDFRTELQGFEQARPYDNISTGLEDWAYYEAKIAEARSQAENAQKSDAQIIAEIRGSKLLTEGKPQLIGVKTVPINYSAITQNTYNMNPNISQEYQVMGKQGAYSYTEINTVLYSAMEFKEEGYIHVIATVSADSVFESAFDRLDLNVTWDSEYRPDLEAEKKDVLYQAESGTNYTMKGQDQNDIYYTVEGYKRRWSEYYKLPNLICGDMTSSNYFQEVYKTERGDYEIEPNTQVETQKTYQFFETGKQQQFLYGVDGNKMITKRPWLDYTDVLIAKNQAILPEFVKLTDDTEDGTDAIIIQGQNQIFFVGVCTCNCTLPMNSEPLDNYTTWGEH